MPFFIPLVKPTPLPAVGASIERTTMDWKARAAATDYHKAKDVAAFANHVGGTLLIGAKEESGQLDVYVGMTPTEAGGVREAFSNAIRDRCRPLPFMDFEEFEAPNDNAKRIVAVNVWPSMRLVGVEAYCDKAREGYGAEAYTFPLRTTTDSIYLTPEQLPMFMTPQVRRMAVMLSKVPRLALVRLERPDDGHSYDARMGDIVE